MPLSCSCIILLALLAQIPLSQHPPPPWITLLNFSCINHFSFWDGRRKQLTRELMIPSLVDNSSSKARGFAHSILFYPVSLEVTCPFPPHLFAVPSATDVGTGSIITKAGFGFSFVLKIFETKRRRSSLFGVPFSETSGSLGGRGGKDIQSFLNSLASRA